MGPIRVSGTLSSAQPEDYYCTVWILNHTHHVCPLLIWQPSTILKTTNKRISVRETTDVCNWPDAFEYLRDFRYQGLLQANQSIPFGLRWNPNILQGLD
jgi:hypothetical protein